MKFLLSALLFVLFASSTEAATRYVDLNITPPSCTNYIVTGTGARTCASPGNAIAYKTIQAGVDAMAAGDTLLVRSGTYTATRDNSVALQIDDRAGLSASARLTIMNYPGETFTIQPPSFRDYIILIKASYVTLRGDNGGGTLQFKLDDVNVPQDPGTGSTAGINAQEYEDGETGISKWHDTEIISLEIARVPATSITVGYNSVIRGNYIHDNKNDISTLPGTWSQGIYTSGVNNLVEGNTIDTIPAGFAIIACPSLAPSCSGTTIKNNVIINSLLGIGLYRMGSSSVYNNLIYNTAYGINVKAYAGAQLTVYSNTVYNATGDATALNDYYSGRLNDCLDIESNNSGLQVKNNIFFTCASAAIRNNSTGVTFSNNLGHGTASDANLQYPNTDPLFVNAGTGNFQLQSSSPAIDHGTSLGLDYNHDIAGILRPQRNLWDIGAYEYGVEAPAPQLVLAMPFETGSGGISNDISGLNNNGSLGAGITWDNSGKYGKALRFDGTGMVTVQPSSSIDLTAAMTIEAWVKPAAALSGYISVITKQNRYYLYASSTAGILCSSSGLAYGGFQVNSYNVTCDTGALPPNTWTHLAITFDGTTLFYYRDGQIASSRAAVEGLATSNSNLYIGSNEDGEGFNGWIDEVRVYNYARTQAEIQSDMNTPLLGAPGAVAGITVSSGSSITLCASCSLTVQAQ